MILDITLTAEKATLSVLALLAPNLRGLLALAACAAVAWLMVATGVALTAVDWVERRDKGT